MDQSTRINFNKDIEMDEDTEMNKDIEKDDTEMNKEDIEMDEDVYMSLNKIKKVEEYIIFVNGTLLNTIQYELSEHFKNLQKLNISVDTSKLLYYSNKFILEDYKNIYKNNPTLFLEKKDLNNFIIFENNTLEKYKHDLNMTRDEYMKLLNKMLHMYDNCFNIDYSFTCPTEAQYNNPNKLEIYPKNLYKINKIFEPNDNFLLYQENIYCKYYKIYYENGVIDNEPVFIGSFNNKNNSYGITYIYNICSNLSTFVSKYKQYKKDNLSDKYEKIKTSEHFKDMLLLFKEFTKNETFALFVETRNPLFAKAFSLYYNSGFKPFFSNEGTIPFKSNENLLEIGMGCVSSDLKYKECQKKTFSHLLMLKTINKVVDPLIYTILYYNDLYSGINKYVKRSLPDKIYKSNISHFYDIVHAMSHRCYCIFDKYFEMNKDKCRDTIDLFSEYFKSSKNKKILLNNSFPYWNTVNEYIYEANQPDYKFPLMKDIVLNNQDLYRFISCVANNWTTYDFDKYSDVTTYNITKFSIVINEDKNKLKSTIAFSDYNGFKTVDVKVNKKGISIEEFEQNDKNDGLIYNIVEFLKENNESALHAISKFINNTDGKEFIFFPFGVKYISSTKDSFSHDISFVYDTIDKKLYFYDSQQMSYQSNDDIKYIVKCASIFMKEIIRKKMNDKDAVNDIVKDISRIKDDDTGETLYAKIQQPHADDNLGSLCVLLSKLPYICSNFVTGLNISHRFKIIQFYTWLFTFYSIKLKYEQKLDNKVKELESNIMILFPYLYCGVYDFIKNLNKIKPSNDITQRDKEIEQKLEKYSKDFRKNIKSLIEITTNIMYSKNELTSVLGIFDIEM